MSVDVVAGVLAGQVAAGARLIRWLEDDDPRGRVALGQVYPHTGRAHLVGVTGPGGVGKSTLVDMLITDLAVFRRDDHASPFRLLELAPGVSAEEGAAKTTASYVA